MVTQRHRPTRARWTAGGVRPSALRRSVWHRHRSRRGATILEVSKEGVGIRQRGAWTTRVTASIGASDILDVDYSSRESTRASAKRATEQQVMQAYPSHAETASPRIEHLVTTLTRFASNKGLTIKTRKGLTTVGQGLDDDEIRYLHSLIRRALIGQST